MSSSPSEFKASIGKRCAEAIAVFAWRVRRLLVLLVLGVGTRRVLPRKLLAGIPEAPTIFFAHYRTLLDAVIVWLVLPRRTVFVVHPLVATARPSFRFLAWLGGIRTISVSSVQPYAIRDVLKLLRGKASICMFPMESAQAQGPSRLYEGASFLLWKTNAHLIPLAACSRQGVRVLEMASPASSSATEGQVPVPRLSVPPSRSRPNLLVAGSVGRSLTIPHQAIEATPVRARHADAHRLRFIAALLSVQAAGDETLWAVARDVADRTDPRAYLLENHRGEALSGASLLSFARYYSRLIEEISTPGETIGLVMPTSTRGAAVYLGTVATGRVAALLPHAEAAQTVVDCARQAGVRTVVGFRAHVGAHLSYQTMGALEDAGVRVVYLDRPLVERRVSLRFLFGDLPLVARLKRNPHAPSTLVFNRDAAGAWKAVLHSDASILAAAGQLKLAGSVRAEDAIFSTLPIYDPMGLISAVILPLVSGARSILQDHPRTSVRIAEAAHDRNVTLIFSDPKVLARSAQEGHACDLHWARSVVVGGTLTDNWLQDQWLLRYGRALLDSCSIAEMGGFVAVNGWMGFRLGSAGQFFPGVEARISDADPSGAGALELRGASAFLGYVEGGLLVPRDRSAWVQTSLRARLTEAGYLFVLSGRTGVDVHSRVNDDTRAIDHAGALQTFKFSARGDERSAAG